MLDYNVKKKFKMHKIELQEGKNKLKKSIKENKKEEDEAKRKRKMEDEDRKELVDSNFVKTEGKMRNLRLKLSWQKIKIKIKTKILK